MEDSPAKISIVEDNDVVREGFSMLIDSTTNYQVVSAYSNCEDAIKNILPDNPDIILMDIELPGMSGIEGIKIIKKQLPETNIIMITVHENGTLTNQAGGTINRGRG